MGNDGEISTSSEIQLGSFVNAELGALSKEAEVVTQAAEVAQPISVDADQPTGRAGATTASKFSVH